MTCRICNGHGHYVIARHGFGDDTEDVCTCPAGDMFRTRSQNASNRWWREQRRTA